MCPPDAARKRPYSQLIPQTVFSTMISYLLWKHDFLMFQRIFFIGYLVPFHVLFFVCQVNYSLFYDFKDLMDGKQILLCNFVFVTRNGTPKEMLLILNSAAL